MYLHTVKTRSPGRKEIMKVWEFLDEKKQLGFRDFKLNYFFSLSRLIWEVTSREEDKDSSLQSEATEPTLMYARWMSSPSGTTDAILFVEDYNIFYIPDVGIEEKKIFPLSQTEVVKPEVIFHGIPDWIYEGIVQHTQCVECMCHVRFFAEDILRRDHAIWVSPDATKIVYATFNDSQVQNVQWKIYGDGRDASVNPYPKEAYMRYPKVSNAIH